ncbi:hypothetical protein P170DRAFT_353006 [Aspergillus steynii IBT 23096]|uniref:C2H2-type domain-containing protein n=1 Tax=Aspergillus steynii IBT 23096 TaxID=1392250 RepID=A0A2I2GKA1_9EURO|nr:uncharacterized protein P170DRAFT_353006 [Aspergillus steynii IBT 23096]PLB53302.1 hypothetical protein P170DRAFT_353006 [Aspergillus steynii IBT 23096]
MEWPTSAFQASQEDDHPGSLSVNPFFFSRSPAAPGSQPVSFVPAGHANWDFTSGVEFPRSVEPYGWTTNQTGLADGSNIPLQGGVALTAPAHPAYDEIAADSSAALYTSSSQPRPDRIGANTNTNSALGAANNATSHQQRQTAQSAHTSPILECKWQGCFSATRFSSEGDLVRHLKSIHISPDAYPCPDCGRCFGRKDHLRDHQKRRHRGLV